MGFPLFFFFFFSLCPADETYSVTIRSFHCSALDVLWRLYTTYIPGAESLNPIFGLVTWAGSLLTTSLQGKTAGRGVVCSRGWRDDGQFDLPWRSEGFFFFPSFFFVLFIFFPLPSSHPTLTDQFKTGSVLQSEASQAKKHGYAHEIPPEKARLILGRYTKVRAGLD